MDCNIGSCGACTPSLVIILTEPVAACDVMAIVTVLSRETGDPLPGASRIAVPILLMTMLRS